MSIDCRIQEFLEKKVPKNKKRLQAYVKTTLEIFENSLMIAIDRTNLKVYNFSELEVEHIRNLDSLEKKLYCHHWTQKFFDLLFSKLAEKMVILKGLSSICINLNYLEEIKGSYLVANSDFFKFYFYQKETQLSKQVFISITRKEFEVLREQLHNLGRDDLILKLELDGYEN